MTDDPRAALDRLLAALEAHFHAVSTRRGDEDPAVDDAYDVLADAFEVYDNALLRVHGETLPFYLADDEVDDDVDDAGDDDDDDEVDEDDLDDLDDDLLDGTELDDAER
ncbi:primosomal protein [Actinotalea ferrariae]|uniref:primosomal protein n=1 Tax=Actinotalea ferrariae TaxID=1386098 RepID=UPI001C8B189A|nr:primosomal protein [Actinotalea ferrariae]MBX9246111.1 primosomal protein [Actinotalea ferrariae]